MKKILIILLIVLVVIIGVLFAFERSKYEIIDTNDKLGIKDPKYTEAGYIFDDNNNEATIYVGERPTDGYSVKVVNVKINNDKATIYIKEVSPSKYGVTTQSVTTPMIKIKIKKDISSVVVINKTNRETLKEISDIND